MQNGEQGTSEKYFQSDPLTKFRSNSQASNVHWMKRNNW